MADELIAPGHSSCAGCGAIIAVREALRALGSDIIVVNATGCMEIVSTRYPQSMWRVPYIHSLFENAPAVASGVSAALKANGNAHTKVVVIAGDGATYDIGFGALSGMLERNDDVLYICYNNECYANCLSLSTLVLTKEGLKKITEIKEGDAIYAFDLNNHNLVLKRCTGVFDNGKKEIFELDTTHHSIKATENHPFLIVQRNGRGKENSLAWKTISGLKSGDEIVVLKDIGTAHETSYKFNPIKITKVGDYKVTHTNMVEIPQQSSRDLMEYLGLYVGDGWTRAERGEVGFALPENKTGRKTLIELHKKIVKSDKFRLEKEYVYINSINLARFIDSLGFGKGAKNKTIPPWVFTLPKIERQAFIEGLMLSDGYKAGNSFRYVSCSHELLARLRLLLQTLDYRVGKIHWRKFEKGTKCVKRFLLKDTEGGYICFSKKKGFRNLDKYPRQSKYWDFLAGNKFFETEVVKSIKTCGIEPTLDLRVEGEHNFIANGIVVHNTGVQRSGATPFAAATTTSPAGKQQWRKNIAFIAAAHGAPYVASACISYPKDFENKLKKAVALQGAKYVEVLSPCPIGWRFDSDATIQLGKKAVETGLWSLFEIENGAFRRTLKPALKPVEEYLRMQGRFKGMSAEQMATAQQHVKKAQAELEKLEASGLNLREML